MRKFLKDLWWLLGDILANGLFLTYPSGTDQHHMRLTCPGCGHKFSWLEGSGLVLCPNCTRVYDRSHPDINKQLR